MHATCPEAAQLSKFSLNHAILYENKQGNFCRQKVDHTKKSKLTFVKNRVGILD